MISYKIGVCKVSKDGKDCKTVFKKVRSNGKTSVVIARPRTGRMHQIRVHLQYLGMLVAYVSWYTPIVSIICVLSLRKSYGYKTMDVG